MGLAVFIIIAKSPNVTSFAGGSQKILSPFALATAISTDVVITLSLVFLLNRSRSGFSKTNRLINALIFYAIQIGAMTVLADVVIIILNVYINRIAFDYLGVYAFVGNVYANSLLASLNARAGLRVAQGNMEMSTLNITNGTQDSSTSRPTYQSTNGSKTAFHLSSLRAAPSSFDTHDNDKSTAAVPAFVTHSGEFA
jgi:hypothetical protein